MITAVAALLFALPSRSAASEHAPAATSFPDELARSHELPPHRRTVPTQGIGPGFHQLRLTLVISPTGDVTQATPNGDDDLLKFWPSLQGEVLRRRFTPFEKDGHAVTAEVEEYLDLVPPQRLPTTHVAPPPLRPNSDITIALKRSGNPELVGESLRYHPKLEARDHEGKTALFAAGEYRSSDQDGARAECLRLLAGAGANINARDNDGNTPLHETFLTEVEEELLKLGADVNARNHDGETPLFTTVDDTAIPLFLEHGANRSIRNNKGQTVVEAAQSKGPLRQEALRKAIAAQSSDTESAEQR